MELGMAPRVQVLARLIGPVLLLLDCLTYQSSVQEENMTPEILERLTFSLAKLPAPTPHWIKQWQNVEFLLLCQALIRPYCLFSGHLEWLYDSVG